MSNSAKIKKQIRAARSVAMASKARSDNGNITHNVIMTFLNIMIFALLYFGLVLSSWVIIPLLAYEFVLIYALVCKAEERSIQLKKMLGPWCLIVPIGMGYIAMLRYSFFCGSETLWMGRSELIVWMISVIIGIILMFLINKNSKIKTGIVLGLLIMAVFTFSASGQIRIINDVPIASKSMNVGYYVEEKSDFVGSRTITNKKDVYLEHDSNHGISLWIKEKIYQKIKIKERVEIKVNKGCLGIWYIKSGEEQVENSFK